MIQPVYEEHVLAPLLWYGWWRRHNSDVPDSASDTSGDGGGVLGV
jgi:hypothetical protein